MIQLTYISKEYEVKNKLTNKKNNYRTFNR